MNWFNKLKEKGIGGFIGPSLSEQLDKAFEEDLQVQIRISSGLDMFKYRTLGKRGGVMRIWKQDSGNVMELSTGEANQLLIYLQFTNSEVPRYKTVKNDNPKITKIRKIATDNGYKEIVIQDSPPMISFSKGNIRINVYHSTMTVGTCLTHPKSGKTQLFRKNVSLEILETLFKNPRTHTGKGYHTT